MNTQQRSVEAICDGTVIDHIPAGLGLVILRQFGLNDLGERVTVGFNLSSKNMGHKDIIKVENVRFDAEQANRLALFAPNATVNVIADYKVVDKLSLNLPEHVKGLFRCPNDNCASHKEPVISSFKVKTANGETKLRCHYREKTYPRLAVTEI